MLPALLKRRPAYFGAGDLLLAITWGGLVIAHLVRAWYTATFELSITDFLTASTV
ncbi:hypothetical protein [uncultured Thiodictyon sp.]|uniref:hypothetical protein n=1 Tax=uncultured Thiodictyon sp. TaxID=1846217 RepID=UPI0025F36F28|nr:hypothetical protein [uncultured Thiodictyon sp.]